MEYKVGFKSGCFSLLTLGHIKALQYVRNNSDYFILIINSDRYVERKKGVIPLLASERKEILESFGVANEVYIYSGYSEHMWLYFYKRDYLKQKFGDNAKMLLFHSSEAFQQPFIPGRCIADEIIRVPDFNETSTTDIFNTIKGGRG